MTQAETSPNRRMGPPGSPNWHAMLDGAEIILRDEGYAALTSRRVAEQIGVKQRLVYYYFHTMDDLIVETFRRLETRELERLREACRSTRPLREIWDVCIHTSDTRLISEFMALANRIERLQVEVRNYVTVSRGLQTEALRAALARRSVSHLSPVILSIFATSAALSLTREAQIGVSLGHQEMLAFLTDYIAALEPEDAVTAG